MRQPLPRERIHPSKDDSVCPIHGADRATKKPHPYRIARRGRHCRQIEYTRREYIDTRRLRLRHCDVKTLPPDLKLTGRHMKSCRAFTRLHAHDRACQRSFDLPSQIGLDSDHPFCEGEFGAAVKTLAALEALLATTRRVSDRSLKSASQRSRAVRRAVALGKGPHVFDRLKDALPAPVARRVVEGQ